MLLFLDFDGVLHPLNTTNTADLFCRSSLLEDLLRRVPWVEVVITSSWRDTRTLEQLRAMFNPDIALRIIGSTPKWYAIDVSTSLAGYLRQAEIQGWLNANNRHLEPWIAIDDQPWLFRPFLANLVCIEPATGLTAALCELLYQKLSAQ